MPRRQRRVADAAAADGASLVKVNLRNPSRTLEYPGPMSIVALLQRLEINRETVLVIRSGTLVPGDAMLADDDEIEIRPVISGGGT